jgi:hypothetical protein
MAETVKPIDVSLPDDLRRQFTDLDRRLWIMETTVAACSALAGLILSYLILFVSDRFWDTPVWLRVVISLSGLGVLAAANYQWARRWIFQRRDLRALSNLVQKKFRRLGDRLLGIVELADEKQRPAHFSIALYRAAIRQVAAEAAKFDFRDAVSLRGAKLHALVLGGLLLMLLMPMVLVPAAGWNAFQRWLVPVASIERYTLVGLGGLPTQQVVPHGEPFEVTCSVEYRSFWRPAHARSQYERQPRIEAAVQNNQVRFKIPPQTQPGVLKIRVGDVQRTLAIVPTYRPSLKQLSASIELPEYLQYPRVDEKVQNGSLSVLEGSRVAFQGKASRPLSSAHLRLEESDPQSLNVSAEIFSSDTANLDGLVQCGFTWKDELGLEGAAPWRLTLQAQKDLPPIPELPDLTREIAILETEVLQLKTAARDDFGVRELGLVWEFVSGEPSTNSAVQRIFKTEAASSQEKKFESVFRFSPGLLKVPAESAVELRAYAKDFFPNRELAYSPIYRIQVLGNERHAEMVRQKLESLLARLEEVTRLEEKVAANTRELKELSKEKLSTEEARERAGQIKDEQTQNAAQLEQLAKEGTKTLREAFRNPTMPEKTLREWAKNAQEMQELSESKMQESAQSLRQAEQNAQSRPQELAKALDKQEEILEDLQQMQKKINQGLDDLQALTLAQRLRKVAAEEKEIGGRLQKNISETIGLLSKDLPAKFQKANAYLSTNQEDALKELQVLQGEISRFFERTQQENYGQVSKEMGEAKPAEALDKVRGLIAENISVEAMQHLSTWSQRFGGWADILDPKKESSSSGGGGGGGGEGNDLANQLMQKLLALLRLRQGEINVRERTHVVDSQKEDPSLYADGAQAVYGTQRTLLKNLVQLQMDNAIPPLQEPLKDIYSAMQEASSLLGQPLTGEPTRTAQTKTIDVLSDVINLINEQAKKGDGSQSASQQQQQEMAFLMQMMAPENSPGQGMTVGRNPGRSSSGGDTDRPAGPLQGDAAGKEADARNVNKGSGVIGNLPTEFREALENYFNAIEKESN